MNLKNKKQLAYLIKDKPKKRSYKKRAKVLDNSLEDAEPLNIANLNTKRQKYSKMKITPSRTSNTARQKTTSPNTILNAACKIATSPNNSSPG